MGYDFQSLVVLPALRLARLREAVMGITGNSEMTHRVMAAVEEHVEVDAYRWGNACPECHERVAFTDARYPARSNPACPNHGHLGRLAPLELLIAFKPIGAIHDP